jgi:sugar/nucleoside kinase (ribokinase family)
MTEDSALLKVAEGRRHDVLCIGTALVDQLSHASLECVADLGLHPGTMTLVEGADAAKIHAGLNVERAVSGGTVANTAVGVAALGGRPAYLGAVADDDLGERYASDLESAGVFAALERPSPPDATTGTGACYVIVTPDAERTMATTLGVSGLLSAAHVGSSGLVANSAVVYFDGYVLDYPDAPAIVAVVLEQARAAGTKLAFGLADPFAVQRHHAAMLELLGSVDLVFANEEEAVALTGREDLAGALESLAHPSRVSVVTRGPKGAVILLPDQEVTIEAVGVPEVRDVTGAGDLFAAGFLAGAVLGYSAARAGALGALLASEAISHLGARPEADLRALAAGAGLL